MRILFPLVFLYFAFGVLKCFSAEIAVLYREDIPFYEKMAKNFKQKQIKICALNQIDKCFDDDLKMIVTLGDLALKRALSYKDKCKIYAFFVTKCHSNSTVRCFYLFPTPNEVLVKIKHFYPKKKIIYLYTEKTKWWIDNFSKAPKYLLELRDLKENLRKIFLKKFDILVLAPDFLFMHPSFLKDLVVLSLSCSKILVGLSPVMLNYGIDVVVYYDFDYLSSQLANKNFKSLNQLKVPIKIKFYDLKNS